MRKKILAIVALFAFVMPLSAQTVSEKEAESLSAKYVANYDSLLNSYYIRKYSHRDARHNRSASLADFDQVPDSVIAARLRSMHTVIPMTYNNVVRSYIRMYLKRMSSRLDAMLTLSEYYYPMFEEVLNRYGVPEELKYLTIVESAMNPQATSRVGAAGLWQFMYTTGKAYDMEVNSVVDDRRDPYKSTVAAARYLKDLYRIYGDWSLAIAAYNCGPGNINKAMARTGGKNFWQIYNALPQETRGYIPAFIAATYVMKFYPEHGLRPQKISLPVHSDTVVVHNDMLLCYVSKYVGIPMEELKTLNPQYRIDLIPGASGDYSLCLPVGKMSAFMHYQDSIAIMTRDSLDRKPTTVAPEQQSVAEQSRGGSSKYHTVRKGETLSSIARKYGTSVSALKKKNKLRSEKIRYGQRLKVS